MRSKFKSHIATTVHFNKTKNLNYEKNVKHFNVKKNCRIQTLENYHYSTMYFFHLHKKHMHIYFSLSDMYYDRFYNIYLI